LLAIAAPQALRMAVSARLCLAALVGVAAGSSVKTLDDKSWKAAIEGKNVFVMFQAPW